MRHLMCLFLAIAFGAGSGCSAERGVEGTVPVTGTVTYRGEAVSGATVIFSPEGAGRSASAVTDETGTYDLTTLEGGDGALPGNYKVTISKSEVVNPMTPEETQAYFHEHAGRMPPVETRQLLPEKYRQAETSGLTAAVEESGENVFPFDLTD